METANDSAFEEIGDDGYGGDHEPADDCQSGFSEHGGR
jgi:hypothetical protein